MGPSKKEVIDEADFGWIDGFNGSNDRERSGPAVALLVPALVSWVWACSWESSLWRSITDEPLRKANRFKSEPGLVFAKPGFVSDLQFL